MTHKTDTPQARGQIAAMANECAKGSRNGPAPQLTATSNRETVLAWLQWNDPNGSHTDERAAGDDLDPYTEAEAWDTLAGVVMDNWPDGVAWPSGERVRPQMSPDRVDLTMRLRLAQIDAERGAHVTARLTLANVLQTLAWHRDHDETLRERIIAALTLEDPARPGFLAFACGHAYDHAVNSARFGLTDAERAQVCAMLRERGHAVSAGAMEIGGLP